MLNLLSFARPSMRPVLVGPAFALAAVACSSGDDAVTESAAGAEVAAQEAVDGAVEETDAGSDTDTDIDTGDVDCVALHQARTGIQGGAQNLSSMEDPASIAEFFPPATLDEIDGHIETLAPYQDVEGVLGTTREGIDRLSADILAVREGRLDDRVGNYGLASINAMLGAIGC